MDSSSNNYPDWYNESMDNINNESNPVQKAHSMRLLIRKLIVESETLQQSKELLDELLVKHFDDYLNYVDTNEDVVKARQERVPEGISVNTTTEWTGGISDAHQYINRIDKTDKRLNPRTEPSSHRDNGSIFGGPSYNTSERIDEETPRAGIINDVTCDKNRHPSNGHLFKSAFNEKLCSNSTSPDPYGDFKNTKPVGGAKFTFHQPSNRLSSQIPSTYQCKPNSVTAVTALPNFHKQTPNQARGFNSTQVGAKRKYQNDFQDDEQPQLKCFNPNANHNFQPGINQRLQPPHQVHQPQQPQHHQQPQQSLPPGPSDFRTGLEELEIRYDKRYGHGGNSDTSASATNRQEQPLISYGGSKKSLGARRTVQGKFVPPIQQNGQHNGKPSIRHEHTNGTNGTHSNSPSSSQELDEIDPSLKNIEPRLIELIRSEIMHKPTEMVWDDIAGLNYAKTIIKEAVVWPLLRPDIFTGLRRPPRGILLFGPPGTGKTLIGKCIASQSHSTFFSISASSLTSKYVGEGEKMVRTLFAVAATHQPAVVFIDEIDSLLSQRTESEHESSRRIKTEFLVQLDGAATTGDERILIVGATNRPQELDEAARRRLVRRLYIPLPDLPARVQILNNLLRSEDTNITAEQIERVGELTDGFSGADMKTLCSEASMGPIRILSESQMNHVDVGEVRAIAYSDFEAALKCVRASVSQNDLQQYIDWDMTYGSGAGKAN